MDNKTEKFYENLRKTKEAVPQTIHGHIIADKALVDDFVESATDLVNNFSFEADKTDAAILNDEVLCGAFRPIVMMWIRTLAELYDKGWYDGRNEFSCQIGKKVISTAVGKKVVECGVVKPDINPIFNEIENKMSRQHRTLQQSFSALCFHFLYNSISEKDEFISELNASGMDLDKNFWNTPLI
jgi:hypothetical protein